MPTDTWAGSGLDPEAEFASRFQFEPEPVHEHEYDLVAEVTRAARFAPPDQTDYREEYFRLLEEHERLKKYFKDNLYIDCDMIFWKRKK